MPLFNNLCRLKPQASLSRIQAEAAGSHQRSLPPVNMQNLRGIWVHLPALMISMPHFLWSPLQKSHTAP